MTAFTYPLAASSWDGAEYAAMQRVIDSGMFSMGKEVQKFEKEFASFFGSEYAVMVNSGSSANLLMVAALFFTNEGRLRPGDEVIVPAVSWSTTYFPLQQYGLKIKFVDIDLNTLNYDLDALEQAVTDATRMIMVVNLLGNPNDFARIARIIGDRDISLIEDNCESMGASFGGKMAGTFGLMGSFSSFFSHHISTMEGGMIVTDNEELSQILRCLRAHGWTRDLPDDNLVCGSKSPDPFKESFRFVLPGYNVRPLEMSGAIGQEQLRKLPDILEGRRSNAKEFVDQISPFEDLIIQEEIGESSWFGFSLVLKRSGGRERSDLIDILKGSGFECRPIVAGNFAKNEVIRYFDSEIHAHLGNAERIDEFGLFIGNQHYDMGDAFSRLSKAFRTAGFS